LILELYQVALHRTPKEACGANSQAGASQFTASSGQAAVGPGQKIAQAQIVSLPSSRPGEMPGRLAVAVKAPP